MVGESVTYDCPANYLLDYALFHAFPTDQVRRRSPFVFPPAPPYSPIQPGPTPQPAPPAPPGPSTLTKEKGVVNPRTGEFLPGTFGGVIDPKTGVVWPKVEGGYHNPKTGEIIPKTE